MLTKQDLKILKEAFFDGLSSQVSRAGVQLTRLNERVDGIEVQLTRLNERVDGIEVQLTRLNERADGVDAQLKEYGNRLANIDSQLYDLMEQGDETRKTLTNHNSRIMAVQDVVIGIDKYLRGELKVHLNSIDVNWSLLEKRVGHLEKRYLA